MHIGLVIYDQFTQLDAAAPFEVFARIPGATVHIVAASTEPVRADTGLIWTPTITLADCPDLDVLCVPGGPGSTAASADEAMVDFVRRQGAQARYVTSVCTGAFVLGAAGLLTGYRATTYWADHAGLADVGAIPTQGRVVIDRNRVTAGGVTAGMDFALTLVAELVHPDMARAIQLGLEYDPQPPFDSGSPETAPAHVLAYVRGELETLQYAAS